MFTLCLGLIAKAEDVLQVVPFSTTAGILENDWEEDKSFSINLTNTLTYSALEFHIYLPEGMTLLEEGGSVSPAFEFNDTRFSGYTSKRVWYPYHDINVTNPEPGHYYVKIYCTEKDKELHKIKGTEGEIFRVYFLTSENMPSGYYPIYVKSTVLGVDSQTGVYPENSVSYVKIGTPAANTVYNLGGTTAEQLLVPSFVQTALNVENNVVVNEICKNLVLTDGVDFTSSNTFTATSASYIRTMGTTWGTICLPYEVQSNDDVEYYQIEGIQDNVLVLAQCATLPANTPALMKKLSGDAVVCSASNVAVGGAMNETPGTVTMHGSYANDTRVEDANAYYIKNDKFWLNNGHFFIDAFRAYFTTNNVGAKSLNIEGLATGIDALTNSNNSVIGVWDANGVKRGSVDKGMNVVKMNNDKSVKIFVK